jgi:elongation factor Ts
MSAITSEQVKTLRGQTGAGIMDCKSALAESAGDVPKAVEILRKKGLSMSLLEINCETDFVAKNPDVLAFAVQLAGEMLTDSSLANPAESEKAKEKLQALAMRTGENMAIRRGVTYAAAPNTAVNCYVHSDNRKAAIVEVSFEGDMAAARPELEALARELSMQSVAMSPKYLAREEVPSNMVEAEREIYKAKMQKDEEDAKALAAETGKPYKAKSPEGIAKMLEGRVNKFFQESCLLEQASIRDSKLTVTQCVKNLSAKLGGNVAVKRFACYLVGIE